MRRAQPQSLRWTAPLQALPAAVRPIHPMSSPSRTQSPERPPAKRTRREPECPDSPHSPLSNSAGQPYWEVCSVAAVRADRELGQMRRATLTTWRGRRLVDIREYYRDAASGEERPGKKGIALTPEQFAALAAAARAIAARLGAAHTGVQTERE
ncbi:hypothetical protein PMAC_002892 [Pneumocystis sp. 'macacae']|nr:hypothetical protein PMAC_002892 [Pneumocystis sp. 'macacae']